MFRRNEYASSCRFCNPFGTWYGYASRGLRQVLPWIGMKRLLVDELLVEGRGNRKSVDSNGGCGNVLNSWSSARLCGYKCRDRREAEYMRAADLAGSLIKEKRDWGVEVMTQTVRVVGGRSGCLMIYGAGRVRSRLQSKVEGILTQRRMNPSDRRSPVGQGDKRRKWTRAVWNVPPCR
jgi:hypothetical protein